MKHLFAFLGNIFVAIVTTSDHASNKKSEFDRFRICPFILLLEAILDLCWDNKLPRKTTNKLNIQNLKINFLFSSKNNNRVKTRDKETNFFKTLMKLFSIVTNKTACQSIFRSRRGNHFYNLKYKWKTTQLFQRFHEEMLFRTTNSANFNCFMTAVPIM